MVPNVARQIAYEAFCSTLTDLFGRDGITELMFRDEWMARLREDQTVSSNGWYDPPSQGMAVLFASELRPDRIHFSSLRDQASWPGETCVDWRIGLMYAYCSPVCLVDGLPGDFQVTLYFGQSRKIRQHFAEVISSTYEIINSITAGTTSRSLFRRSEELFKARGLRSNVASTTDSVPVDLGHSLPLLMRRVKEERALTLDERDHIRRSRMFISDSADWCLADHGQVTIEPRLFSLRDPVLPQVSVHYVLSFEGAAAPTVLNECDSLYSQFGLLP